MPKLYRRQVAHRMEVKAKIHKGTLISYLEKKPDTCYELQDFLDNGVHSASPMKLHEFLSKDQLKVKPDELVFGEKPSTVVDEDGKIIKEF